MTADCGAALLSMSHQKQLRAFNRSRAPRESLGISNMHWHREDGLIYLQCTGQQRRSVYMLVPLSPLTCLESAACGTTLGLAVWRVSPEVISDDFFALSNRSGDIED